jgi:signal transduction histidine kinase
MKHIIFITAFLATIYSVNAQQQTISSLRNKLTLPADDETKGYTLDSLAMYYLFFTNKTDSSYYYIHESIDWAFTLKDKRFLILAYERLGFYYVCTSQLQAAIEISLKGVKLAETNHVKDYLSALYYNLSWVYGNLGDLGFQLQYACKAIPYLKDSRDPFMDQPIHVYGIISAGYLYSDKPDSAFYFLEKMRVILPGSKELIASDIYHWYLGSYYLKGRQFKAADSVLAEGAARCEAINDLQLLQVFYSTLARSYIQQGKIKDAIPLLHHQFRTSASTKDRDAIKDAAKILYRCYSKLGMQDSAFYYLRLNDSLQTISERVSNNNEVRQVAFDTQLSQKEEEANLALQNVKDRNKIIVYVFLMALVFFLVLAIVQWRNNKQKKEANRLLQQQKEKVEITLAELKGTQNQLIQSEKMASLGELTAGIAHEIQNPLNFVNNFSEVNIDLLKELNLEAEKGNDEEVRTIAKDISSNSEKINHHGKRAASIVKGMLQHSRGGSGQKELTDINVLADEYLRLAYHGLRAKDKSFNAITRTDFDNNAGSIDINPQDIGRVILNLINNAFYAVSAKALAMPGGEFTPTISVATKRSGNKIEIRVTDNGAGIPQKIKEKIFQPFFTTKPTGQGTGLGLSLSYDIIKAHGGELKVETREGEGSTFIIQLPIT